MLKSLGLGICCLTLGISGVTRASIAPVDCGKYGDDKCLKIEKCLNIDDKCDTKSFDFKCEVPKLDNKVCDIKDDHKDCFDVKPICDDKDDHKVCNFDHKTPDLLLCDVGNNDHKDCGHLVVDPCGWTPAPCGPVHCDPVPCNPAPCGHDDGGNCAAVPAPASAAFGGLGVAGIMLMAGLRSRRSAIC